MKRTFSLTCVGMAEGTSTQKARRCVREANQEAKQKNHKEAVKLYEDAAESYDLEEKYEAQRARPNQGIRTKFNVYWDRAKKWKAYITKGKGKKPPKTGESGSKNNYEKKLETELEKAIMVADVAGLEGAKKVPIKFPHVFTGKQKPWKGILLFGDKESNQSCSRSQDDDRYTCTEASVPLKELREENLLCDAVLRLEDGGVFPVHRVILSMRSEYFRNLFTTTLHASEETDTILHGVSSDVMTQILNYIYFRAVDIHSDNACQLLVTADYLCIPGVKELCCDFLKDAMDVGNCIDIMHFARSHFCVDLETRAFRFVLRHFVEVSQQNEELMELSAEDLHAIIRSRELNVKDERVVWECVLRWINHDPNNRKGHIAGFLKGVRLGLLDAKFFKEKVSNNPYVTENMACLPIISEALSFLHFSEMMTKEFVTPKFAYPRIPQDILFAVGGYADDDPTDVIEAYDARADRWSVVEGVDSIGPRSYHGTAVVGFDIYVVGGADGVEELSSCSCFDAVTKTCREVAPMHDRRGSLVVAVLRGAVYAMGGFDGRRCLRKAERYDCKTNQWSRIAPMKKRRLGASAAVLNDKIYVAGGYNENNNLKSVEVYDPDTDQWTFVAPMHSGRSDFSCVAFNGCLYALGGDDETSDELSAEKYDPAKDTWTMIAGMNFYADYCNAEVIDDTIFVIGGGCKGEADFCVKCYNDKEDKWYLAADMNFYRFRMSTCVIKNLPNASDYAYKQKDKLMEERRKKTLNWENQ